MRNAMQDATVVIPSLDAVTEKLFRQINRPSPQLQINTIIEGLIQFRKEYYGQIWIEVFIVPGLNDTKQELTALKRTLKKIEPDQIQLNTLDRPGSESIIRSATQQELKRILDFWQLDNATIIAKAPRRKELLSYRKDPESAILETITRRPCTLQDLSELLGLHPTVVNKYLNVLEADEKIIAVEQNRGFFYQAKHPFAK